MTRKWTGTYGGHSCRARSSSFLNILVFAFFSLCCVAVNARTPHLVFEIMVCFPRQRICQVSLKAQVTLIINPPYAHQIGNHFSCKYQTCIPAFSLVLLLTLKGYYLVLAFYFPVSSLKYLYIYCISFGHAGCSALRAAFLSSGREGCSAVVQWLLFAERRIQAKPASVVVPGW